jgi:lipoprotein-releasing system permease protein
MSRLPFELVLALRYLRPKRTFVSVITLISILGVTLGVAVLIIVIAVMSGFDRQLRDKILGFNTHLKVLGQNHSLPDYALVAATVRSNASVVGVTPFVMGKVLLETQPRTGEQSVVDAPYVRGVDPATEGSVSVLPESIIRGQFNLEGHNVIVGSELASKLGLQLGDRLGIFSPEDLKQIRASQKQGQEAAKAPVARDFTVGGIFDVGYYDYNANVIVMSLENAQQLYALADEDQVHGLMVMLKDPYQAAAVRQQLLDTLGTGVFLTIWTEENSAILGALAVEKNMMFYLLFFIMIVAALCIMSALITFVVQKTREIGMLKALGATNSQVAWLFLGQSAIVGVIGVLAGFGLGMLAVTYRNEFLRFMRRATQFELFPAEIYGFGELPALIMPTDIAMICSSALVICLLAGLLPAWNASRLQPVEALRHE